MSRTPISRLSAGRYTIMAQVGAGGLLLVGGVLAMTGVPMMRGAPDSHPLDWPKIELTSGKSDEDPSRNPVDMAGVAERLAAIGNPPKPVEAAPTTTDHPKTEAAPPPAPPEAETRYLGAVSSGSKLIALVNDGNRQRFVHEGEAIHDGTVSKIEADRLTIAMAGGEKTLDLAPRTGDIVTRTTRRNAAVVSAPGAPGQPMANAAQPGAKNNKGRPGAQPNVQPMGQPIRMDMARGANGVPNGAAALSGMSPEERKRLINSGGQVPPERFDEIVSDLRRSGAFQNDDELVETAKKKLESEQQLYLERYKALKGGG